MMAKKIGALGPGAFTRGGEGKRSRFFKMLDKRGAVDRGCATILNRKSRLGREKNRDSGGGDAPKP